MDGIPAHRCSDIGGRLFYRYIVDYKRLDRIDIDYIDNRFMSVFQVCFSFKTTIPFPKYITNKILHGSSSFQCRTGLLIKWVSWNISARLRQI